MNKVVWKFTLTVAESQGVMVPESAWFLHVDFRDGFIAVWAAVDPTFSQQMRTFRVVGTGCEIPDGVDYLGSVRDGIYVWHLFVEPVAIVPA
jgi:hypothetical protein